MSKSLCPSCGKSVEVYHHKLTSGLVGALRKFKEAVVYYGVNDLNPSQLQSSPFEMTFNERGNWTKLRFHAMIAKVYNKDGSRKHGHWLITHRGSEFLKGNIEVAEYAITLNNTKVDESEEKISIKNIDVEPYFEDINTIQSTPVTPGVIQEKLI